METDEEGTLASLKEARAAAMLIVEAHGGRLVGTAGDGLLLEFPSVVEAVRSAVKIQALMADLTTAVPDESRMFFFRAGINLSDGVNVAARIEALAEPGGICLSAPGRPRHGLRGHRRTGNAAIVRHPRSPHAPLDRITLLFRAR